MNSINPDDGYLDLGIVKMEDEDSFAMDRSDTSSSSGYMSHSSSFIQPKLEIGDMQALNSASPTPSVVFVSAPGEDSRKRKLHDVYSPKVSQPKSILKTPPSAPLTKSPSPSPFDQIRGSSSYSRVSPDADTIARTNEEIIRAVRDPHVNNRILDVLYNACMEKKKQEMQEARKYAPRPPPPRPPPPLSTKTVIPTPAMRRMEPPPDFPSARQCSSSRSTSQDSSEEDYVTEPRRKQSFQTDKSPSPEVDEGTTNPTTGILRKKEKKSVPKFGYEVDETKTHTRCNICNQWFLKEKKQAIRYHVLHHCPMKEYQCRFCNYCHHELGKIKRHQKNVHKRKDNEDEVLQYKNDLLSAAHDVYMKQCFPNYDTGKLQIGRVINYINMRGDQIQCYICKKRVFQSLAAYHIVDKHMKVSMYVCDVKDCKYKSVTKRAVRIHKQASHKIDSPMDALSRRLDYTEDSDFTIKSFFPEKIDLTAEDCQPEFKMMHEIKQPSFDRDFEWREMLAEQDGLTNTLDEDFPDGVNCLVCQDNGCQITLYNLYSMILHMKSHVDGPYQWQCPEQSCDFSSKYKIDVDIHLFEKHEGNDDTIVNGWHQILPTFYGMFRRCFPMHEMPMTYNRPDHRARPIPIKKEEERDEVVEIHEEYPILKIKKEDVDPFY